MDKGTVSGLWITVNDSCVSYKQLITYEKVLLILEAGRRLKTLILLTLLRVVLHGSPRSPDIHDLSECDRLYDLGRHKEQP